VTRVILGSHPKLGVGDRYLRSCRLEEEYGGPPKRGKQFFDSSIRLSLYMSVPARHPPAQTAVFRPEPNAGRVCSARLGRDWLRIYTLADGLESSQRISEGMRLRTFGRSFAPMGVDRFLRYDVFRVDGRWRAKDTARIPVTG
jgi:hypothetical protein